jgi:hypothetical protein
MKPTELIETANAAQAVLALAATTAGTAQQWLDINTVATRLLGSLRVVSLNEDLLLQIRADAAAAAEALRDIQRESCQRYEALNRAAA